MNRPTRATAETATIIDHIYTYDLDATRATAQGIVVTDITDHYPMFNFHSLLAIVNQVEMMNLSILGG